MADKSTVAMGVEVTTGVIGPVGVGVGVQVKFSSCL